MAGTRRIGIAGSTGRLGSLALRLVAGADDLEPVELDVRDGLGLSGLDAIFDATVLDASERLVDAAVDAGVPVVVGTSGWTQERIRDLRDRGDRRETGHALLRSERHRSSRGRRDWKRFQSVECDDTTRPTSSASPTSNP